MTTTYGTLSTIAGEPIEVRLVRRGASSDRETGFVASRTLRANVSRQTGRPETRVWRLTFGPEDFPGLLAKFDAARGAALPLLWTPPTPDDAQGAVPVRFVSGTLRVRKGPGLYYEAECELEEVA